MSELDKIVALIKDCGGKVYRNQYSGMIHWANFDNDSNRDYFLKCSENLYKVIYCTGSSDNDWNLNFMTKDLKNHIVNMRVCKLDDTNFQKLTYYNNAHNIVEVY